MDVPTHCWSAAKWPIGTSVSGGAAPPGAGTMNRASTVVAGTGASGYSSSSPSTVAASVSGAIGAPANGKEFENCNGKRKSRRAVPTSRTTSYAQGTKHVAG